MSFWCKRTQNQISYITLEVSFYLRKYGTFDQNHMYTLYIATRVIIIIL